MKWEGAQWRNFKFDIYTNNPEGRKFRLKSVLSQQILLGINCMVNAKVPLIRLLPCARNLWDFGDGYNPW